MKIVSPRFAAAMLLPPLLVLFSPAALGADQRFDIIAFKVEGNSLLSEAEVGRAVHPLIGAGKDYGDVQKALEALELSYRKAGYSAVQVYMPEQELTGGIVRIEVSESTISTVTVTGNKHFDEENIRSSLRALQVGKSPRLGDLSEAIQLANDNPAKQVEVTLAPGAQDNTVDAKVAVTDSSPVYVALTHDNTGTNASGKWRTGVALQHGNLFNRDHVATLAYTSSPDSPSGVHVNLWSVGYRIPLYALGDSIDLIYGNSSVNTPSVTPTLGGFLGILGKGDVWGMRWNHFFARQGSYTSKLVYSIDRKYANSRCSFNGIDISIDGPTPLISSCVPYTTIPLGITYSGRWQTGGEAFDFNVGLIRNVASGERYTNVTGRTDRYSYLTPGNRDTKDGFMAVRAGASFFKVYASDWQVRLAASAQLAHDPLLASEQFGLAGSTTVRGFNERAAAADGGLVVNAEVYTPNLAGKAGVPGNLRLLTFYDVSRGYNLDTGSGAIAAYVGVASAGVGVRYSASKDVNVRADVARVITPGPSVESAGAWKLHISIMVGY